jgi:hypothetical protein
MEYLLQKGVDPLEDVPGNGKKVWQFFHKADPRLRRSSEGTARASWLANSTATSVPCLDFVVGGRESWGVAGAENRVLMIIRRDAAEPRATHMDAGEPHATHVINHGGKKRANWAVAF